MEFTPTKHMAGPIARLLCSKVNVMRTFACPWRIEAFFMKWIAIILLLPLLSVRAAEWRPDDRLLNAVREIESSGGKFVYGDDGRSLGEFQITQAAWTDVTRWRRSRGLATYSYRPHVFNPEINRLYAADYITILRGHLVTHLKREPTAGEIYAAYNMGFTGFRRAGFDLNRVNRVTARKSRQIMDMVGSGARASR
jgi:hypothetical protein